MSKKERECEFHTDLEDVYAIEKDMNLKWGCKFYKGERPPKFETADEQTEYLGMKKRRKILIDNHARREKLKRIRNSDNDIDIQKTIDLREKERLRGIKRRLVETPEKTRDRLDACSTYQKKRRVENPEIVRQRDRGYAMTEMAKETKSVWRSANPEKIKEYSVTYWQRKGGDDIRREWYKDYMRQFRTTEWYVSWSAKRRESLLASGQSVVISVRTAAQMKKLDCDLSDDQIKEYAFNPCHYCGDIYSGGVDRVDSTIGYLVDNCVPCCTICNFMKKNYAIDVFIDRCKVIASHLGVWVGECKEAGECFHRAVGTISYEAYSKITTRGYVMELSKSQFNELRNGTCYLTGLPNANGIDRVDNSIGYTIENCRPCSKIANYMKRSLSIDVFTNHVQKIASHWSGDVPNIIGGDKTQETYIEVMTNRPKLDIIKNRAPFRAKLHENAMNGDIDAKYKLDQLNRKKCT